MAESLRKLARLTELNPPIAYRSSKPFSGTSFRTALCCTPYSTSMRLARDLVGPECVLNQHPKPQVADPLPSSSMMAFEAFSVSMLVSLLSP